MKVLNDLRSKNFITQERQRFHGKKCFRSMNSKKTDIDGKHTYSSTVTVKVPKSGLQVKLLTNPVLAIARLSYLSNEKRMGSVRLVNMQGSILVSLQQYFVDGMNQISIPVNNLPAGNYFIELN